MGQHHLHNDSLPHSASSFELSVITPHYFSSRLLTTDILGMQLIRWNWVYQDLFINLGLRLPQHGGHFFQRRNSRVFQDFQGYFKLFSRIWSIQIPGYSRTEIKLCAQKMLKVKSVTFCCFSFSFRNINFKFLWYLCVIMKLKYI